MSLKYLINEEIKSKGPWGPEYEVTLPFEPRISHIISKVICNLYVNNLSLC
jgi:hypothetical protein